MSAGLRERLYSEALLHFGSPSADELRRLLVEAAAAIEALESRLSVVAEPVAADAPYCGSSVVRGHESFGCLERVGHKPPHRGPVVPAPCVVCDGLEAHVGVCCVGLDDWEDAAVFEVTWGDDGVVVLLSEDEVPY